jgi:hypothetical protein
MSLFIIYKKRLLSAPLLLTLVFLLPAFTDLLRKMIPGQPNLVTPLISAIFILFCFIVCKRNRTKIPKSLVGPIQLWAFFLFLYSMITLWFSVKVFVAVIFLRFVPFLIPIVVFRLVKNNKDFEGAMLWVVLFVLIIFPIALYSILFGSENLPNLLKPIEIIHELGRDKRGEYDICSAIFSKGAIITNKDSF